MTGQAGQTLAVEAAIEASGDRDPDTIFVSFYASRDKQVTASDYFLGQVNLSLSANSWTTVTLRSTFPTSIPPGTYYVGWIIDPDNLNDESNESNNTAFNPSSMLTVVEAVEPVLYVDSSARGADDGSCWNDAFNSLQDALAKASAGWEIRVADGVYAPDRGIGVTRGDRRATFALKPGVIVAGGYAGTGAPDPDARDAKSHPTTLSGDLNGDDAAVEDPSELWSEPSRRDNSMHVVTLLDAGPITVLDGVRITGGYADETAEMQYGAGLYISAGSPRVQGCEFSDNWTAVGGGAICTSAGNAEIIDCVLCGNASGLGPEKDLGGGSAVFVRGGSATLINCSAQGNFAWGRGGAVTVVPGAVFAAQNCCFHANEAATQGGTIYAFDSLVTLVNCTLVDYSRDSSVNAVLCETWVAAERAELRIANCILWGHERQIAGPRGSLVTVAWSDVQGGWPGVGNLDSDPLFVDPDGPDGRIGTADDDLRLGRGSLCIDAGSEDTLPEDVLDLDGDGDVQEPLPIDLAGGLRVVGGGVDLGAYEADASTTESPSD